ncbi:trypsin-like serine protease [Pseudomonas chlororaphis]|uniref:trypsin-like serine protease n=1 Tax=Pseudomonas chlororaphis TaxID=587753 RepID=UPI000F58AED6|nr:trypsin-like serine protease [Pseudomonas chlororaphis]
MKAQSVATTGAEIDINSMAWERALQIQIEAPGKLSSGSGSWISSDLVITASHLANDMPPNSLVRVGINGRWVNATVVAGDPPQYRDLMILRVNENEMISSPIKTAVPICEDPVEPAEQVLVSSAFTNSSTYSYGSPDFVTQSLGKKWSDHVTGYYPAGTSGGAVYKTSHDCLAGVISLRQMSFATGSPQIYATKFITAKQIKDFITDHEIKLPANFF